MQNERKIWLSGETSHRANFSQFGIVIRTVNPMGEPIINQSSNKGSTAGAAAANEKSLTKIFYLQQIDFGGYLLPTQS